MPIIRDLLGGHPVPAGTIRVPFPNREDSFMFVSPLFGNGKADHQWFLKLPQADRMYDGMDWRSVGNGI